MQQRIRPPGPVQFRASNNDEPSAQIEFHRPGILLVDVHFARAKGLHGMAQQPRADAPAKGRRGHEQHLDLPVRHA